MLYISGINYESIADQMLKVLFVLYLSVAANTIVRGVIQKIHGILRMESLLMMT